MDMRIMLLLCLISMTVCRPADTNFIKSFFTDVNGKIKGIFDQGMQAVHKVNTKLISFAKSGQIMLSENLPDNNDIVNFFKQTVTGAPFEISMNVFHAFCSAHLPEVARARELQEIPKFKLILMTSCENFTFSINDVESMWDNKLFDSRKKVVVLVTGWMTDLSDAQDPAIHEISKAYLCRGDVNFIALDTADYLYTFYDWAALNTEEIGADLGKALSFLKDRVSSRNIHLIGHSLGAHIVSAAGRTYFKKTDKLIGRITGLDPAQPCFNEGEHLKGISRGDAEYVDIIHSNPGVLGKKEAVGDADFYPNGFNSIPNGCLSIGCAHNRAWEYYAESVYPGNENNFLSAKCSSMKRYKLKKCNELNVPMGYPEKRQNVKGNYFLETKEETPFGLNASSKLVDENCGLCLG